MVDKIELVEILLATDEVTEVDVGSVALVLVTACDVGRAWAAVEVASSNFVVEMMSRAFVVDADAPLCFGEGGSASSSDSESSPSGDSGLFGLSVPTVAAWRRTCCGKTCTGEGLRS